MTNIDPFNPFESDYGRIRPKRDSFTVDSSIESDKKVETSYYPVDLTYLFIYKNGFLQDASSYDVYDTTDDDTTSYTTLSIIDWSEGSMTAKEGDIILVDYYIDVI